MTDTSLAARERAGLADLLDGTGPDAPTCCAGWTTAHLAAHLVVRDRRPDALLGFGVERVAPRSALVRRSHRLEEQLRAGTQYPEVVARVRSGPPVRLPGVDRLLNTAEFAIHHEDVRRAQPGWVPRTLAPADQDTLWTSVRGFARLSRRPLLLRRSDVTGAEHRVGSGEPRTLTGEPMELLLWLSGRRDVARVEVG